MFHLYYSIKAAFGVAMSERTIILFHEKFLKQLKSNANKAVVHSIFGHETYENFVMALIKSYGS